MPAILCDHEMLETEQFCADEFAHEHSKSFVVYFFVWLGKILHNVAIQLISSFWNRLPVSILFHARHIEWCKHVDLLKQNGYRTMLVWNTTTYCESESWTKKWQWRIYRKYSNQIEPMRQTVCLRAYTSSSCISYHFRKHIIPYSVMQIYYCSDSFNYRENRSRKLWGSFPSWMQLQRVLLQVLALFHFVFQQLSLSGWVALQVKSRGAFKSRCPSRISSYTVITKRYVGIHLHKEVWEIYACTLYNLWNETTMWYFIQFDSIWIRADDVYIVGEIYTL